MIRRIFGFQTVLVAILLPIHVCEQAHGQCLESLGVYVGSQSTAQNDSFGGAISVKGDWMCIGAPNAAGRQNKSGLAYMFRRNGGRWVEQSVLFDPRGREFDFLGSSVSLDGEKALVGASGLDLGAPDAGGVVVYTLVGTRWEVEGVLAKPKPQSGDGSGQRVLLDGDYAYVGAPSYDLLSRNEGVVHVYHFDGDEWNYEYAITAPDPMETDSFGSALVLDGDTLIVGAYGLDPDGVLNAGGAFVYRWINDEWVFEAQLNASDPVEGEFFGRNAGLSGDWAVFGVPKHNDEFGAAYVFKREGNTWSEYARLDSPDPGKGFGEGVGLDGDLMVIGQPGNALAPGNGRAFRYRLVNDEWTYEDRMRDIDTFFNEGSKYGSVIAMSPETLVIQSSHVPVVLRLDAVCVYDRNGRCGPVLSAETGCPSQQFDLTIRWSNATPNGRIALIHSPERGYFTIPNNFPCLGTWLGLSSGGARIAYQGNSGPNGGRVIDGHGTRALCGTYINLLDVQSCLPSNVVRLDRDTGW